MAHADDLLYQVKHAGRQVSLIVLAMLTAGTIGLFSKLFTLSRRITCWVDAVAGEFYFPLAI